MRSNTKILDRIEYLCAFILRMLFWCIWRATFIGHNRTNAMRWERSGVIIRDSGHRLRIRCKSDRSQNASTLQHPAGPGRKLIFRGSTWVLRVWLQLFTLLPKLKSVLPHLKYKSLCASSTRNVSYTLSTLRTGPSCLSYPPLKGIKHLVLWATPYRIRSATVTQSVPKKFHWIRTFVSKIPILFCYVFESTQIAYKLACRVQPKRV